MSTGKRSRDQAEDRPPLSRENIRRIIKEESRALLEKQQALKPLMDIKEVAKTLNISKRTAETLLDMGDLPSPMWFGGQRRWDPDTIEAYIRSKAEREGK